MDATNIPLDALILKVLLQLQEFFNLVLGLILTCWPKGDLCSPYQTARQAESKESPGMGKSEAGEELSMHWA